MLKVFNVLLLDKNSILLTSCVKISEQFLDYYVKYNLFNLKVSKIESHKKWNLGSNIFFRKNVILWHKELKL